MWAAIAPHSKQHTTPRSYYKSIYDTGVDEITAEEYEQTCNAWGL